MAIIKDQDQLKETVKVNNSSWHNWQIFLNDAQDMFLVPYLGRALVDKLETLDEENTSEADKKYLPILRLARRALGPFAVMLGTDEMSINTGETGHTVSKTDTLAPASDSKIGKAAASLESRAWNNMEMLLEHLECNIADFSEWKTSKYYLHRQTKYFPSAEIFQDQGLVDINYSRLTFEKLKQLIIRIEKTEVVDLITAPIDDNIFADNTSNPIVHARYGALLTALRAYIGARVAELHTSEMTRTQRLQDSRSIAEYKAVIRPLFEDLRETGNFYKQQAEKFENEIITLLTDLGVNKAVKLNFNSEERKIFYGGL